MNVELSIKELKQIWSSMNASESEFGPFNDPEFDELLKKIFNLIDIGES